VPNEADYRLRHTRVDGWTTKVCQRQNVSSELSTRSDWHTNLCSLSINSNINTQTTSTLRPFTALFSCYSLFNSRCHRYHWQWQCCCAWPWSLALRMMSSRTNFESMASALKVKSLLTTLDIGIPTGMGFRSTRWTAVCTLVVYRFTRCLSVKMTATTPSQD